jgi:hypothetical protein
VAVIQYTFTHKQYTEYREHNIHNNKNKKIFGKCGPCPVFASYTLAFALQLRKKQGKISVRVIGKAPDIQVAVVQYNLVIKVNKCCCESALKCECEAFEILILSLNCCCRIF